MGNVPGMMNGWKNASASSPGHSFSSHQEPNNHHNHNQNHAAETSPDTETTAAPNHTYPLVFYGSRTTAPFPITAVESRMLSVEQNCTLLADLLAKGMQ
ncbi:hypothetical protein ACA910_016648 [Epithemia clementina (nom. ined.)]